MLLTVYGYPAPVKRSPQTIFGSLVPPPITQRTSGVSVAVDTVPQYPDLSYEPMIPYGDGYLRPYAIYKRFVLNRRPAAIKFKKRDILQRQTTPMESSTSPPSGGSANPLGSSTSGSPATSRYIWIDPMPPMLRGLPTSSQGTLNPLTSASRGLPVGQYANPLAYAKSRPPANQVPAMQVLPMQQLNTGTLIGN